LRIDTKFGTTMMIQGDTPKIVIRALPFLENGRPFSLAKTYEAKYKEAKADGPPSAEKLLALADWALTHGLNKEFNSVIDEAEKSPTSKDNPTVKAVLQVRAALAQDAPEPKDLAEWQSKLKLNGFKTAVKGHYILFHNATKGDAPEVVGKLERLEENLRHYYYWFALKGKVL